MLLNGGELDGRRYLSAAALKELSSRQTPKELKESYGLGLAVGPDFFGHGGAQATGMEVRTKDGLVIVWMVQHQGFPGKGGQAQGEFKKWAVKEFGAK
jgi:CubicO group peptidase (beta-lactamase class C family)